MNLKANFITALALLGPFATIGCKVKSSLMEPADAVARRAFLQHVASDVIASSYDDFATKMARLEEATAAAGASASSADLTAAQDAYREAILSWERAVVFQVGPAAPVSAGSPGGQGLGNEIDSWPTRNFCGLEAALLDQSYADAAAFEAAQFTDTRSLETLEVLLFDTGTESHCDRATAVDPGAWADLVAGGELPARRAAYASTVAQIVRRKGDELVKAFAAFIPQLSTAGKGSKLFPTTQDALNAVTDSLFYIVLETKDMKLAGPAGIAATKLVGDAGSAPDAGISVDCGDTCADLAELRFSKLSREAVVANLMAFRDIFFGSGPSDDPTQLLSFADLLRSVSADRVADEMQMLTDTAIADAQAITPSIEEAAGGASDTLDKSYMSMQELSTRLKTDFLSSLSLALPMSAAADND